MTAVIFAIIILSAVLVIASGIWVAVALIGAIAHIERGPASAEDRAPDKDRT